MRISNIIKAFSAILLALVFNNTEIAPAEARYCKGKNALGVSRTVTLNTSGGARYGSSHGRHRDFLRHKEVVLTFDDGPIPQKTLKVLKELERHCTKATFFMVGRMAASNPGLVRRVLSKGHTVGAHGHKHRNLGHSNARTALNDVTKGIAAVQKASGKRMTKFFRFPYLSESSAVNAHLNNRGYGVFAIDVDSKDYRISNPNSMVNRVMSELRRKGKGIVLLHDIQRSTANGIGRLLDRLNAEGYKIVHIKGRGERRTIDPVVVASTKDKTKKKNPTRRSVVGVAHGNSDEIITTFKRRPKLKSRLAKKREDANTQKDVKVTYVKKRKKAKETLESKKLRVIKNDIETRNASFAPSFELRLVIQ